MSRDSSEGRVPPQAVDVEMAVLGAMLLEQDAIPKVLEILDHTNFYKPANQYIFKAIVSLFEHTQAIDLITTIQQLKHDGNLEKVGGEYYLADLCSKVTTSANVEYHAHIVLEKSLMRQAISLGSELASRAYNETEDIFELLDVSQTRVLEILGFLKKKQSQDISRILLQTLEAIDKRKETQEVRYEPTGFKDLDRLINGLHQGDLIVIAGRPSQGKTALLLGIAKNISRQSPITLFSIETSESRIALRLLSMEASLSVRSIEHADISPEDGLKIAQAVKILKLPIYVDDSSHVSLLLLRSKIKQEIVKHKMRVVFIDYLQLMEMPKAENRTIAVGNITRELKLMAKDFDIPIVVVSQLNRASEKRDDKRPTLADLRDSGAIEQDADLVIFVHRPETYNVQKLWDESPSEGMAEIIVAKQRDGPVGRVKLGFLKHAMRFFSRDEDLNLPKVQPPDEMPF